MTLDVKLPRWLAVLILMVWVLSLVETMVCQAVSALANVHYLETQRNDPPPPWPGQPILKEPEREPATPKDERPLRRKKENRP